MSRGVLVGFCLLLCGCVGSRVPRFAEGGCINTEVRDTLFVYFPAELEDETCEVEIHSTLADFRGSEQIRQGRVWFDMLKLPPGIYDVWIRVAEYYFKQTFRKE